MEDVQRDGVGWRGELVHWLNRGGRWLEARSLVLAVLLGIVFVVGALERAAHLPLWHDELFTYWIAQAPSIGAMFHQLQTLDLNPPLNDLLVRLSFHLFGVSALTCRLPSIAGYLLGLGCAFVWLRRRIGGLWGCAAMLAMMLDMHAFATEARPYALLLGFVAMALLGVDLAYSSKTRWFGCCVSCVAVVAALLSHVFAVPVAAVLLVAEMIACWRRDWRESKLLVALLLPFLVLPAYAPMLRSHAKGIYPPAFVPSPATMMSFFGDLFVRMDLVVLVLCIAALVLGRQLVRPGERWPLPGVESAALLGMLLSPALLMLYLMATHGSFFVRYGFMAQLALAMLVPVFLFWMSGGGQAVALLMVLVLLPISGTTFAEFARALHPATWKSVAAGPSLLEQNLNALHTPLPLVINSGLVFVEVNARESNAVLQRTYFLLDPASAATYAHANIFNGMQQERDAFKMRGQVEDLHTFEAQHAEFLVLGDYGYPEDWLLRALAGQGAEINLVEAMPDSGYRDSTLWKVTLRGSAPKS